MPINEADFLAALKTLEASYTAITTLKNDLERYLHSDEDRAEFDEAIRRYREAHHRLRRRFFGIALPSPLPLFKMASSD